jgi:microcompartment protein CcmK/EutM
MTGVVTVANAQITSLQVDSVIFPSSTVATLSGTYTGLLPAFSPATVRIWCNGMFSNSYSITSTNGTFTITIYGLSQGTPYPFIPKITSPFSFDGTTGTFTTPTCNFTPAPTLDHTGTLTVCSGHVLNASPVAGSTFQWMKNGTAIQNATAYNYAVISSGVYTCAVTKDGCTMVTPGTTVNVNGAIGLTTEFSDTTICIGSSVNMMVQVANPAGVTYLWTPSDSLSYNNIANPVASPSENKTYVLTVSNNSGCSESVSVTIFVVQHPNTTSTVLMPNGSTYDLLCTGQYEGLTSSILINGQHFDPNPEYNTETYFLVDSVGLLGTGDWVIIKTVSAQCAETFQLSFAGISFEEFEKNGKVFPNPFVDEFFVSLNTDQKCTAKLFNSSGELIVSREVEKNFKVEENLPSGDYILQIISSEGKPVYLTKLVKVE